MINRRDFLKFSSISSVLLLTTPFGLTCSTGNKKDQHFLFNPSDIPEIKKRLELPLFQSFWQELAEADLESDLQFLETEIQYNNQLRHLSRLYNMLLRESFVYAITKDNKRGDFAKLILKHIMKFEKWDYFIEDGKYTIGLQRAPHTTQTIAIVYDWIGDLLTDSEKDELLNQLAEKGCEPCYRSLYGMLHKEEVIGWGFDPESSFYEERDMRRWPWILSRTNLRAVPMSALGLGALRLQGIDSRADKWLKIVKQSLDDFHDLFEPDGSYPEGLSYARYTCGELILFFDVLIRLRNKKWHEVFNWPGIMDFFLMTRMPSSTHPHAHVNFGDAAQGHTSDIGFWVAKHYNDGQAQFAGSHHAWSHRIYSVIWYDPNIEETPPKEKIHYRHFDIGWVIVSKGFDPDDFVLALRSGGPGNHEHADRNSLILKCYSENLLVDNWRPPYSHEHPAWPLRTSLGHNCVIIDGRGHQYHDGMEGTNASLAEAKVIKEEVTDEFIVVTSDATPAYHLVNENVKNVNRTFITLPEYKFSVVVDCLETNQDEASFTTRWFIDNIDSNGKIEIDDNHFIFNRPMARLVGYCNGSHKIKLSKNNFPVPEEHGIYPYMDVDNVNKGKRVNTITAFAIVKPDENKPRIRITNNKENWVINTKIDNKNIIIQVKTGNIVPVVSVSLG